MIDWASKIGPNYVEVIDSHVDWQNAGYGLTNSAENWITLQLKGPASRAGIITEPIGMAMKTRTYLKNYKWRGIANLHGGTYGNTLFSDSYELGVDSGIFRESDFNTLKESFVLYGDTPGAGFFAWQLM
ncbi:MAG: hypothetical protein GY918_07635, partial [Gammaproteobacteria bacterium]|nr:hypothetical protein [Gammaproteobacteria bacterium]